MIVNTSTRMELTVDEVLAEMAWARGQAFAAASGGEIVLETAVERDLELARAEELIEALVAERNEADQRALEVAQDNRALCRLLAASRQCRETARS
jgi:hypothetical protein